MKWPASVTLVRHAESAYNELRQKKREDSLYDAFLTAFERIIARPKHAAWRSKSKIDTRSASTTSKCR